MHQTPRTSQLRIPTAMVLLLVLSLLPAIPGAPPALQPPVAEARVENNPPGSPIASAVECIRPGANPGESPQFLTTCFASLWTSPYRSYNRAWNEPLREGDSPASETAVLLFGDTKQGANFPPPPSGPVWLAGQDGPIENKGTTVATVGQVGAVYGLAVNSGRNPGNGIVAPQPGSAGSQSGFYTAAFTKRATRFGDFGPGAIYFTPWGGTYRILVTIPDVVNGPEGAPFDLGGPDATGFQNPLFPNGNPGATVWMGGVHLFEHDTPAITSAGRSSLGDIDLDPQERFLFAVNLNTKRVYQVDTWAAAPQATVTPLPSLVAQLAPCAGRGGTPNYRPFGLLVTRDHLYLGGVCSAEVSRDRAHLAARVDRIAIDGSGAVRGGWENVLGFGLTDYDAQRNAGVSDRDLRWLPWQDDDQCGAGFAGVARICPQPILADLALDERGHLILGFRDRYADITGSEPLQTAIPAGDIMRAPWDGSRWSAPSTWVGGEVFSDATTMANGGQKAEVASGALAYVPGTNTGAYGGELVTTWLDPYEGSSFGAAWFNAAGGAPTNLHVAYRAPSTRSYYFSKSAGLGDLELVCAWSAVGDSVWNDTNANGVQDAGEPGLNGVRVQLFAWNDGGFANPIQTVTTGNIDGVNGRYRFYVRPFQQYRVRLDPAQFQPGQTFAGWYVTRQNQGGDDTRDSDAHPIFRAIDIAAQGDEEQNVTYDFGMTAVVPTGELGDRVWNDTNRNGIQNPGEPGVAGVPVNLFACNDLSGVTCASGVPYSLYRSTATDAAGAYFFGSLPPNFYVIRMDTLPPGFAVTTPNVGGDDTRDSDFPPGIPWGNGVLTVLPASIDRTQDMGLVPTVGDATVSITGPTQVDVGTTASYTVRVTGSSTGPVNNITLVVTIPAATTTNTSGTGATLGTSGSNRTLTWSIPTLAAGTSADRTFTTQYTAVSDNAIGAQISASPPDSNTANNTAATTTRAVSTNLGVEATAPATVGPDEAFSYVVTVGNRATWTRNSITTTIPDTFRRGLTPNGSGVTANLQVTLPATVERTDGQPIPADRIVRFTITNTGATFNQSFTIPLRLRAGVSPLPASIAITASVVPTMSRPALDVTSDESVTTTTPIRYPDLVVDINANKTEAGEGGSINYTVDVRNSGNETARNVRLVVTLPAGVTAGTPSGAPSAPQVSGQTLTWANAGDLGAGASLSRITIPVTVNTGAAGTSGTSVTARAEATTTTPEPNVPNVDTVNVFLRPPPTLPQDLTPTGGLRLAIHSDLDPLSQDGIDTNAVYRSDGAAITWPLGEVLDFTPRASVTLPSITPEEAALYELRARIDRWSIASFTVGGRTLAAATESDVFGRSGCRTGATQQPGLEGCSYAYLDGQDATRSVTAQRLPTETEMAGQAHVMWAANGPASMVEDVYVWRVSGLERVQISVQVLVRVDVVSRDTGTVVRTENRVLTQTYDVTLIAPRSVR